MNLKKKPIQQAIVNRSIREDIIQNLIDTRKQIVGGNTSDAIVFLDRVLAEVDPCWRIGRT